MTAIRIMGVVDETGETGPKGVQEVIAAWPRMVAATFGWALGSTLVFGAASAEARVSGSWSSSRVNSPASSFANSHVTPAGRSVSPVTESSTESSIVYRVSEVTSSGWGTPLRTVRALKKNSADLSSGRVLVKNIPEFLVERGATQTAGRYREWLVRRDQLTKVEHLQLSKISKLREENAWPNSEVRTLVLQGPSENRIDLTFVGDGYQLSEKEEFFADVKTMVDDLFTEVTYSSYLPLFNVHAVFVPSRDSGISDLERKNTALGLYRSPAGSKRAIMPGNTSNIDRAIALAPDTDYPILLANDDFYGGLGGRYAITTRANVTGPMVLRHELGHNFGNVGEEYDGGQVYEGANSSTSAATTWAQWLAPGAHVFEGRFLEGAYVWQNLRGQPFSSSFSVPEGFSFVDVIISAVGWASPQEVKVTYDGQLQNFSEGYTSDRSFFDLETSQTPSGPHTIEITDQLVDEDNVVAFVDVVAHKSDIITDPSFIAAYPTFSDGGGMAGYRPTYEGCLMREMRTKKFCSVDQENMWLEFLNVVALIDKIEKSSEAGGTKLVAKTPNLPLVFAWKEVGTGTVLSRDSAFVLPAGFAGLVELEVTFKHPEIRKSSPRLTAKAKIRI